MGDIIDSGGDSAPRDADSGGEKRAEPGDVLRPLIHGSGRASVDDGRADGHSVHWLDEVG